MMTKKEISVLVSLYTFRRCRAHFSVDELPTELFDLFPLVVYPKMLYLECRHNVLR